MSACASLLVVAGCALTASQHRAAVRDDAAERLTVGKVQQEIRVGISGAEVLQVLGSPNIVSTDDQRREVWAYDRIATERAYSTSYGGIAALILGGALAGDGFLGAAAGPHYGGSAGASASHQRTFTVIVKFDDSKRVRDFAYHATSF